MVRAEFEKSLSKRQSKRRLVEVIIMIAFAALCIACLYLREATKEVIIHEGRLPSLNWEEVTYKNGYMPFFALGLCFALSAGSILLVDLLYCRFATVPVLQKELHHITVYRGICHQTVYVDGVEKGRIGLFSFTNVVEVWLPERVKVSVCFSYTWWFLAHIFFSDDTATIEV